MLDIFCCKDVVVKFILKVDGEEIEIPPSLMMILAANKDGCLNHFLAGYFHKYPDVSDERSMFHG